MNSHTHHKKSVLKCLAILHMYPPPHLHPPVPLLSNAFVSRILLRMCMQLAKAVPVIWTA